MKIIISLLFIFLLPDLKECVLLANFSHGPPIYGLVGINDDIFVVKDSQPLINVYKGLNLQIKLNASLPSISGPYDMVGSSDLRELFILDWFNSYNVIHIKLYQVFESSEWQFTSVFTSAALSLSYDNHILITNAQQATISEYTPTGILVKFISIKNITSPRQSIKINFNLYAVCFGYGENSTHGVCIINSKGTIVKCLQDFPGNGPTQFNVPARMAMTNTGAILIADMKNSRIVELSPSLANMKILFTKEDGLINPSRIFIDKERSRILVANNAPDPVTGYAATGNLLAFKYQ